MKGLVEKLDKYWIFIIIVSQPILDMIAYFTFNEQLTVISFVIRTLFLIFSLFYTFIRSKNRRKYILYMLPFAIFCLIHFINSYRTYPAGAFNDLRYMICVWQFPILTIAFCDYIRENKKQNELIEKGIVTAYMLITLGVLLSIITNSYDKTYEHFGITGWFTSANTQSMILAIISPIFLYFGTKKRNITYSIFLSAVFFLLYINGTKACYLTLVLTLVVICYTLLIKARKNKYKLFITFLAFVMSIACYKFSATYNRISELRNGRKSNTEISQLIERGNLTKEETIYILNSTLFRDVIADFGEDKVYEIMKDRISLTKIYDNRELKKVYGQLIFDESDTFTKYVGFSHGIITSYQRDVENDFTGIFYYYGYIGFSLYVAFILYFAYKGIKTMVLKPIKIVSSRFVIFTFAILLGLFGAEESGALLRKPNSNIYFSLIFAVYYLYLCTSVENINYKIEPKSNNITFLLLHLGYGGIETATINTANALCDRYNITLMSFYNLDKNQTSKLNKKIKIDYLYNGKPNRDEFIQCLKKGKIFSLFRQGFKAINILFRKKYSVAKYIINCDSKYIISTRHEFSKLLSKYGNAYSIKIAQEHQYHNDDKKYIDVIKNKYDNIDYLMALTETLENDYKKFLINNKHTKVILMPNMLYDLPNKSSNVDNNNIVTVSRLDSGKRVNEIIDIFDNIKNTERKLYIIGDGDQYNDLLQQVKELNLEDKIILTGYKNKDEIEKYFLNSSLFMMASISEGLPMVLLEAMSYGIPCIAYRTASGVADIIKDGYNGFIIENRDQNQYIEKSLEILNNFELRKQMSKNAQITATKFSKEEILKKWYNLLENC